MTLFDTVALVGCIVGFAAGYFVARYKREDEVSAAFESGVKIGRAAEADQSRARARGDLRELREHLAAAQANGEDAWLIEGWQDLVDEAEAAAT